MEPFTYTGLPARVVFGHGTIKQIAKELERLGCSKALVLTTPQQISIGQDVCKDLDTLSVGRYSNATMHTPVDVTEDALKLLERLDVDCLVAVGGGSTIGLGKALALRTDLSQIVVPTTYAGSEATAIIGQTENGAKTTQVDLKVLPEVIIYDVDLTMTLPLPMTMTSGFNAIAHAIEAMYSPDTNPITRSLAVSGIKAILQALPLLKADTSNVIGREKALYGAWACGTCLGQASMGLHHKLCHLLGGTFDMPHAETHTVILPHAIAYNERHAKTALAPILELGHGGSVAQIIWDHQQRLGVPTSLKDLGFQRSDLERAAALACQKAYPNPAPLVESSILKLLENAYEGVCPVQV